MRLPLELSLPTASTSSSPSVVVDPDSGELLLLELQGELELQGDIEDDSAATSAAGARVGKLDLSISVRSLTLQLSAMVEKVETVSRRVAQHCLSGITAWLAK